MHEIFEASLIFSKAGDKISEPKWPRGSLEAASVCIVGILATTAQLMWKWYGISVFWRVWSQVEEVWLQV